VVGKRIIPEWHDEDEDFEPKKSGRHETPYGSISPEAKFSHGELSDNKTSNKRSGKVSQGLSEWASSLGFRIKEGRAQIDLHGMTLEQSKSHIDRVFAAVLSDGRIKKLCIITGRGQRSQGRSILAEEIHPYVIARFGHLITSIDASPGELTLGGLPWKGAFNLNLK
jgi:DNA-nicking Smr family endonuclease